MKTWIVIILCHALLAFQAVHAQQESELLAEAEKAYQANNFKKAIMLYEQLLSYRLEAPELYFNLGNAHYKSGNLPAAILNYEKAKKLNPTDEDLLFNLAKAQEETVDRFEAVPQLLTNKAVHSLAYALPLDGWTVLLILLCSASFAAFGFYAAATSRQQRKFAFITGTITAIFLVASALLAFHQNTLNQRKEAIIFEPSVTAKSMPAGSGTSLFVLHEGTKVQLLEENNGWVRVRLADGNVGWLPSETLKKIETL